MLDVMRNMTSQDARKQYLEVNVEKLSRMYFLHEGSAKRRKHFEEVWLATGLQARKATFTLERVFRLLGLPDLASGNSATGMVGWLMQSVTSKGEQDVIVGFDVDSGAIRDFWSNSITPECSPARHMVAFAESEMKEATTSNKSLEATPPSGGAPQL